ncbi:MAG: GYD domain-containing protein [Chloroflexi bacterium]|nr:GYD domain-containing protein [Chloroflexota bacterium]
MATYIMLLKWTQQGVRAVTEAPDRIKQNRATADQMGIRSVGIWVTMGEYDLAAVFDAPDDQTMAAFALAVARRENSTSQTMRAFSEDEFVQIASGLPKDAGG